ncbi:MAG: hypothetical protein U0792_05775 [Gemmataceae bacterium]
MSEPNANSLIVSVSGVRGIVGRGLTASVAARFAAAFGSTVAGKPVVVCRDGRPSGDMLRPAVIAGLLELGCVVEDIGIAPTPTCGFAVRQLHAAGGIQITASHNPAPWNGLKMFGPDGAVLSAKSRCRGAGLYEGRTTSHGPAGMASAARVPPASKATTFGPCSTRSVSLSSRRRRSACSSMRTRGLAATSRRDCFTITGCELVQFSANPPAAPAHPPEPIHAPDRCGPVGRGSSESAVGFVLVPIPTAIPSR